MPVTLYTPVGRGYNAESGDPEKRDVFRILAIWGRWIKEYRPFFERQWSCDEVLADRPWTNKELSYAATQNRDLLHIPIMRVYDMNMSGAMRGGRSDFSVDPVDDVGDPKIAEVAGKLLNTIAYDNKMPVIDTIVFNDGLAGKGDYHLYVDYLDNPLGEVRAEASNPYSVMYDPEFRDPWMRDCRGVIYVKYMTPEDIEDLFPGKLKGVKFDDKDYDAWLSDEGQGLIEETFISEGNISDRQNGLYAVIEYEERKHRIIQCIIDVHTGDFIAEIPRGKSLNPQMVNALFPNGIVVRKRQNYMKKTIVLPYHSLLLDRQEDKYTTYSSIPVLSRRRGDMRIPRCTSYHYGALGLQRELNIRHSNIQETIVRSLRGGYWVRSKRVLLEIEASGHKVGKSYFIEPGEETPEAILPQRLAEGLEYLERGSLEMFTVVTGLNVRPMGKSEFSGESGAHAQIKREESQTTIYPILDDYDQQRALMGSSMLERVVDNLTVPRMVKITGIEGDTDLLDLSSEMIENFKSVSRWDIRVEEGPFVTTQKREQQDERLIIYDQIIKNYGPELVLPGDIIRGSSLPNAKELGDAADERWKAKMQPEPEGSQGDTQGLPQE